MKVFYRVLGIMAFCVLTQATKCEDEEEHENLTIRNVSNDTLLITLRADSEYDSDATSTSQLLWSADYGTMVSLPHTEGTVYGFRKLQGKVYVEVFNYQLYRDYLNGRESNGPYSEYSLSSKWFSMEELNKLSRTLTYPYDFDIAYEED